MGILLVYTPSNRTAPIAPSIRAKTIEQTVIGQFQFMSMRRTRERFVWLR